MKTTHLLLLSPVPANTIMISVFMSLAILGSSYKANHVVVCLCLVYLI